MLTPNEIVNTRRVSEIASANEQAPRSRSVCCTQFPGEVTTEAARSACRHGGGGGETTQGPDIPHVYPKLLEPGDGVGPGVSEAEFVRLGLGDTSACGDVPGFLRGGGRTPFASIAVFERFESPTGF